jgi:pimeloyl-ACP methyl ester carboxylesterase
LLRKIILWGVLAASGVIALVAAVELGVRRPYTPAIAAEAGAVPIALLEELPLRGANQSVLIRGRDRQKPILLFLHGGPGMPVMFLAHAFQRDMERDFVVVHWDRRGAGRSYHAYSEEAASVRSTLDDLYALVDHLRRHFPTNEIHLVGHSWGTYLGLLAAHERPELFASYVGSGQMAADPARIRAARTKFFMGEANRRQDLEMQQKLASGGSITEDDLFRYGAELRGATSFWPIFFIGLRAPEYTLGDVMNVPRGSERVGARMRYNVLEGPLDRSMLRFRIPIYFFLGRHDWNEPSILAADYLQRIAAPAKGLVWFEKSAHFPFLEEPEQFRRAMRTIVKQSSGARLGTPNARRTAEVKAPVTRPRSAQGKEARATGRAASRAGHPYDHRSFIHRSKAAL